MTSSLVSVIMPIYNADRYVSEAIQSVLAQSYRSFELLLVDDASTDRSAEIAEDLAATYPAIRLLHLAENRGPAAARNLALVEAEGGYITFLDADDVMPPQRLALQVHYLTAHPDADVIIGAEESVIEADAPRELLRRRRSQGDGTHFYIMSMMMRRRAMGRVGGFDPSYRVAEDLDWLFRASAAGLVVEKMDAVLTLHRLHASNLSVRTRDIQASILRSLRTRLVERR